MRFLRLARQLILNKLTSAPAVPSSTELAVYCDSTNALALRKSTGVERVVSSDNLSPASGNVPTWNGTKWTMATPGGGGGTGYTTIAKTVDQSVTNSNSLQDDNELTFTLDANSTYMFDLGISVSATTPSHKIGFTAPSGAVGVFNTNKDISGGTSDTYTNSNNGVGTSVRGFIRTTASGGAFTLQWAQDFADGTASTVKAGSFLSYVKVVG